MKNFLFLLFIPFVSLSQTEILPERPSFKANLVENSPELDGNILEDEIFNPLEMYETRFSDETIIWSLII